MSTTITKTAAPTASKIVARPQNGEASGSQQPKSQKTMTKAERRELQEKQRAAKAAVKPNGSQHGTSSTKPVPRAAAPPPTPSTVTPQPKRVGKPSIDMGMSKLPKHARDASSFTGEDMGGKARGLRIFAHFGLPKPPAQAKGDIHPAIIRLGLLFSDFKISGANARCIATLTAFKFVIQDYSTPANNTLSRHLMTHLSPQITHIVSARPMSVTMGNAIRQLKLEISGSDIDLPEQDAKDALCRKIDNYIRDRIIIADQVIQETAGSKIKDGAVILTYARSSVVEKVLLGAFAEGKKFTVIVVDSRPMLEGKKLLSVLSSVGIPCTYLLLPAIGSVIAEVSLVFLGAHSLHANGAVFSRAGTASVAMMAKQHSVPVIVCCETYKFSEGILLDSFSKNELAPLGNMFSSPTRLSDDSDPLSGQSILDILNPLYDLTPPTNITAVVTEVGIIPPSSISSIPLALGRSTL